MPLTKHLRVAIIDSNPALKSRDYLPKNTLPDSRVSTVTPATISFFKGMVLWMICLLQVTFQISLMNCFYDICTMFHNNVANSLVFILFSCNISLQTTYPVENSLVTQWNLLSYWQIGTSIDGRVELSLFYVLPLL
jgi:hypothetical protein